MSRRRFLQGVGATAAASAITAGPRRPPLAEASAGGANVFGRMFPSLPAFAQPSDALADALLDIGRPGGVLDANDDLSKGPVALIVDPALSAGNPDNPRQTAGTTFFGQFIDHDITFDATSALGTPAKPQRTRNERTAALDLDSVYGAGPVASSHLYDPDDAKKLRLESGGRFEDLPRTDDGTALLGDGRNDENLVIAGLHCAMIAFHNRCVDLVRAAGTKEAEVFERARRLTRWHYQWLVLHEFLPQVVGEEVLDAVRTSRQRAFRPSQSGPVIPVEFQGAAFRFGHSVVRPSYRANFHGDAGGPFFAFIFDTASPVGSPDPDADPNDLVGGFRAPRRFIDWRTFFAFDDEVRPNKQIDTKISTPLFDLPLSTIADGSRPTVLAQRNLLRHVTWSLPSGQDVAARLGVADEDRLDGGHFDELEEYKLGLEGSTPLWYYVLKEAEVLEGGLQLGPVGGRVVAEVLVGLLEADRGSFLNAPGGWTPTLGGGPAFAMTDLLTFAGVHPRA